MSLFKKKKPAVVFIATPVKNGVPPCYVAWLFNLTISNQGKYHFEWSMNSTGSQAISRDSLARVMLDMKEATGILFIDTDMKPTVEQAYQIIDHRKPIVGGVYARKQKNHRWVMTGLPGEEIDDATGLLKVKEIGTGFLWISREVFEAMIKHLPAIEYDAADQHEVVRPMWNFFFQGVVKRRFLGEDYGFCHFARQLGFDIYADTRCIIPHTGEVDYPLPDERKLPDAESKANAA